MATRRESEGSGVQALIDRLRDQGVEAGRQEAERLVAEARARAASIVQEARDEARTLLDQAHAEIEAERSAARAALLLAARDTMLELKGELSERFAAQIRHLAAAETSDPEFLRRLILEVAGNATPSTEEGERVQLLLPREAPDLDQLRRRPDHAGEGPLRELLQGAVRDMLRDGVELGVRADDAPGVRLRLVERDVEIDLTDKAIASLLLRHLMPRFHALLEGLVR